MVKQQESLKLFVSGDFCGNKLALNREGLEMQVSYLATNIQFYWGSPFGDLVCFICEVIVAEGVFHHFDEDRPHKV